MTGILFVVLVTLLCMTYIVPMVAYLFLIMKYRNFFTDEMREEVVLMVSIAFCPLLNAIALAHMLQKISDEENGEFE